MYIDVKDHDAKNYRCFLNGEDISDRTYAADDVAGWADTFCLNEVGRKYRDGPDSFAKERLWGMIELRRIAKTK